MGGGGSGGAAAAAAGVPSPLQSLHFQSHREPIASASFLCRSRLFKSFAPLKLPLRNPTYGLASVVNPSRFLQIHAAVDTSAEGTKWWQKGNEPNMHDIYSTQEFLHALSNAGEKLVVVEFFATWCGSCRALYPKLCQLASDHPEVEFLKVDYDANKTMCKSLNVKFLPFFHFYRGANGRLDSFSCSLSKLSRLKEAIEIHNTDRCSLGPPLGLGEDVKLLGITPEQLSTGSSV